MSYNIQRLPLGQVKLLIKQNLLKDAMIMASEVYDADLGRFAGSYEYMLYFEGDRTGELSEILRVGLVTQKGSLRVFKTLDSAYTLLRLIGIDSFSHVKIFNTLGE